MKNQVKPMNASDFGIKSYIEFRQKQADDICEAFDVEIDPTASEVLDTIHSTPLGRLLKIIGSLPEIRHENLDLALDMVLEEFLAEN
jgi:hypothetical protein